MSDEVIDLSAERDRRTGPDPEFRRKDDFGRPMFLFLLDYRFDGGSWTTELWAYDEADAQARVDAMRESLTCLGKVYSGGVL